MNLLIASEFYAKVEKTFSILNYEKIPPNLVLFLLQLCFINFKLVHLNSFWQSYEL